MTSLEDKLYNIGNKIVGNVGSSTATCKAVTGEEYVTFFFITKKEIAIYDVFKKWVKAYVVFIRLTKPEASLFEIKPKLTIYWRAKPEIRTDDDGSFCLRARLLISRREVMEEEIIYLNNIKQGD